jgi:hypothetical protein
MMPELEVLKRTSAFTALRLAAMIEAAMRSFFEGLRLGFWGLGL